MSKINNKNLISFSLGLLIIFAFTIVLIPQGAKADFVQRCEILNFNASANHVIPGGYTILNWNTRNCDLVSISNVGTVNTGGYKVVYPAQTTVYILTAISPDGAYISQSKTITVVEPTAVSSTSNNNTNSTSNTSNTSNTSKTNNSNTSTTNTTNTTNTTETTNQPSNQNQVGNLAAGAIFGYNSFLPSSIFQWFFFAILILLGVVLWRKLYVSESDKETPLKHA